MPISLIFSAYFDSGEGCCLEITNKFFYVLLTPTRPLIGRFCNSSHFAAGFAAP